jgi:hypothetical protein
MIILKVFQDNIPRDKRDMVTFKVEKVFLKSQLEEQGYILIEKSEENNPVPPKLSKEDTLRGILLDYTGKGHTGGGFTDELRENTINEIIDTFSKPSVPSGQEIECFDIDAYVKSKIPSVKEIQRIVAKELGNEAYGVEKVIAEKIHNLIKKE